MQREHLCQTEISIGSHLLLSHNTSILCLGTQWQPTETYLVVCSTSQRSKPKNHFLRIAQSTCTVVFSTSQRLRPKTTSAPARGFGQRYEHKLHLEPKWLRMHAHVFSQLQFMQVVLDTLGPLLGCSYCSALTCGLHVFDFFANTGSDPGRARFSWDSSHA